MAGEKLVMGEDRTAVSHWPGEQAEKQRLLIEASSRLSRMAQSVRNAYKESFISIDKNGSVTIFTHTFSGLTAGEVGNTDGYRELLNVANDPNMPGITIGMSSNAHRKDRTMDMVTVCATCYL